MVSSSNVPGHNEIGGFVVVSIEQRDGVDSSKYGRGKRTRRREKQRGGQGKHSQLFPFPYTKDKAFTKYHLGAHLQGHNEPFQST